MHSRLPILLVTIAFLLLVHPPPTRACQMVCVVYSVSSTRGVLMNHGDGQGERHPIPTARLIVRDASASANGPEVYCARKGPIVLETSTDKRGDFHLKGLHPGKYFVTYMNAENGQSFLVEIHRSNPFKLLKRFNLPMFDGDGQCYAVDIERNVTIPDWGGIRPVKEDH